MPDPNACKPSDGRQSDSWFLIIKNKVGGSSPYPSYKRKDKKMKSNLIGKKVYITDSNSIYFGEWGIIDSFDGEVYFVRIADGKGSMPIFDRDQFRVPRKEG